MSETRTAFFDIENAPSLGYYYDPYKEGNIVATEQPWFMLSFAWKRPKEKQVICKGLIDYPGYKKDKTNDRELVKDLWELFDSHDVLIGHNIARFDSRKAAARFLYWGLPPPSPLKMVDTLKQIRKIAYLESNRLGDVGTFFGYGDKLPTTGWDTWHGCINGDRKAWDTLKRYNKRDVALNEQIWERMAPYIQHHPALSPAGHCPVCSSNKIQHRGFNISKTRKTPRLHCQACGHWFT